MCVWPEGPVWYVKRDTCRDSRLIVLLSVYPNMYSYTLTRVDIGDICCYEYTFERLFQGQVHVCRDTLHGIHNG